MIRVERNSDPEVAFRLEQAMGWPRPGREVARRLDAAKSLVAFDVDATPVGSVSVAVYEGADGAPALAWLGGMAVLPAHRGRGVGRALLDAALHEARAAPVVGLDATDKGRALYARAGFRERSRSTRWVRAAGEPRPITRGRHSIHPISISEAMEIAAYDLERFGAKRMRWLMALLHEFPWTAFMSRDRATGNVTGFVFAKERSIGPLVADDDEAAAALLAACELAGGPPALLVPDAHVGAARLLGEAGWRRDDASTTRMLRGGDLPGDERRIYAYATSALG